MYAAQPHRKAAVDHQEAVEVGSCRKIEPAGQLRAWPVPGQDLAHQPGDPDDGIACLPGDHGRAVAGGIAGQFEEMSRTASFIFLYRGF